MQSIYLFEYFKFANYKNDHSKYLNRYYEYILSIMVEIEVIDCMNDIINQVVKKEQHRIAAKKWRENNRDKVKQSKKKYNENNKEKISEYQKQYQTEYREKNREKLLEYNQTEKGIKRRRISHWKASGLICDNYQQLYNHYLKTAYCDACKVKLTYDKQNTSTTKMIDHCHESGLFRNILCLSCNNKRKQSNF
jgi:hypothetical protein